VIDIDNMKVLLHLMFLFLYGIGKIVVVCGGGNLSRLPEEHGGSSENASVELEEVLKEVKELETNLEAFHNAKVESFEEFPEELEEQESGVEVKGFPGFDEFLPDMSSIPILPNNQLQSWINDIIAKIPSQWTNDAYQEILTRYMTKKLNSLPQHMQDVGFKVFEGYLNELSDTFGSSSGSGRSLVSSGVGCTTFLYTFTSSNSANFQEIEIPSECRGFLPNIKNRNCNKSISLPDDPDKIAQISIPSNLLPVTCTFPMIDKRAEQMDQMTDFETGTGDNEEGWTALTEMESRQSYYEPKFELSNSEMVEGYIDPIGGDFETVVARNYFDPLHRRSLERKLKNSRKSKYDKQYKWAAKYLATIMAAEGACKPQGRVTDRKYANWFRGCGHMYNRVGWRCYKKCSYMGSMSYGTHRYCYEPCSKNLALRSGCGWGFGYKCVGSDWDCGMTYLDIVMDFADIIAFIGSGGTAGMAKAAKNFAKAGSKAAAKAARKQLQIALKKSIEKLSKKFMKDFKKNVRKAVKDLTDEHIEKIFDGGAQLMLVSNFNAADSSFGDKAWEMAELVDPTGVVSFAANFRSPEQCNPNHIFEDKFPAADNNESDLDPLYALDGTESGVECGIFYIKNTAYNKYISVSKAKCHNGNNIILYDYHGGRNQQFYFKNGAIMSVNCEKALDISAHQCNSGTNIQLWDYNGARNQKFEIRGTDIWNKQCNKVITSIGDANGNNINIWTSYGSNAAQCWEIIC
jgi:hypothetical protein